MMRSLSAIPQSDESYKLKEIRLFLAIMVTDNETVCT